MTLEPFSGFTTYPTHHCVTGSLKHIYDFHGFPVTEDLLLGLGQGIGFAYFHIKGTDPFYGGRANHREGPNSEGLEKTVGRNTGVAVESHTTTSSRKAADTLRELLISSTPVFVQTDMGFLPYFDFPEEFHFGGHTVVVAGYDAETDDVLIADRDRSLHRVGWSALEKARGSKFKPFPPKHRWLTFDFSGAHPPNTQGVRDAITGTCHQMLNPPIANLGTRGIRKAKTETLKWPNVIDSEGLRRTCFTIALFIDHRGGTGGGLFRYMYARFLSEAAEIASEPRLAELAPRLNTIGDRWEQVASAFAHAATVPEPANHLEAATAPMDDIADLEQQFWEDLANIVDS